MLHIESNDLEKMSPAQLLEVAHGLLGSHVRLVLENAKLSADLGESGKEMSELKYQLAGFQSKVATDHLLVEEITQLKECIKKLEEENTSLKEENGLLRQQVQLLQTHIRQLEKEKVAPVTVREAMRILERWVCFRAVGLSKTKFKSGFYCFDKIQTSADTGVRAALAAELTNLGLSSAHLGMLAYLKDCGDYVAHKRDEYTVLEWEAIVCGVDEESEMDEDEVKEKKIKTELVAALSAVVPHNADGALSISDPVEKPIVKPVLKQSK